MASLSSLPPVSLQEIADAALMDRAETKYLLPVLALPTLLAHVTDDYRVLTIGGQVLLPYRSLYLDTPGFDFYHAHHNGRGRRYKVRFRSYEQTNTTFLEVKERRGNGRTIKTRAPASGPHLPLPVLPEGLLDGVPVDPRTLEPKLWVNYRRVTLVGRERPERVTVDLHLELRDPRERRTLRVEDVAIVELKRASLRQASPLAEKVRAQGVRECGFSKYGVGCSALHPVKHNSFKPQLLSLERLRRTT